MTATAHKNTAWQGILTRSEAEVVELVAQGLTNRQVAAVRVVEEQTVKFHLSNAYLSLGIRSRSSSAGPSAHDPRVLAARWWWETVEMGGRP